MYDVDAMIHLLVHPHYETNKPINELIANARIPQFRVLVKFDYKKELVDIIKPNDMVLMEIQKNGLK